MFRKRGFVAFLLGVVSFLANAQLAYTQGIGTGRPIQNLITQSIDEGKQVTLRGTTRPEANARNDRGRVADEFPLEHMLLQLRRSPEQEQALQQFISELDTQDSPNFHRWINPQQFGATFGVSQQDLATITGWLESHGFRINVVYPSRLVVDFSGTAGQVRSVFHTEIHNLEIRGEKHIANMSDPQIPAALAYVARRRGEWDRSETYFNEAERFDPRNVRLLNEHASTYVLLRRFPKALRKLDEVLNIAPDDMDILALKAGIAQAEGDLPRAAALLGPLHPPAAR